MNDGQTKPKGFSFLLWNRIYIFTGIFTLFKLQTD